MTNRELVYFNHSPSYWQQISTTDLIRKYMACCADCSTICGDQTHWLCILAEAKCKDRTDLDHQEQKR